MYPFPLLREEEEGGVVPCWHMVVWFGLCSGHVPVRQPDPTALLPQRGSDRPETPRDGENFCACARACVCFSLCGLEITYGMAWPTHTEIYREFPTVSCFFFYLSCRLPLSSKTAWWNSWRSSCLKNHPTYAVSNLMMPSSQVHSHILK